MRNAIVFDSTRPIRSTIGDLTLGANPRRPFGSPLGSGASGSSALYMFYRATLFILVVENKRKNIYIQFSHAQCYFTTTYLVLLEWETELGLVATLKNCVSAEARVTAINIYTLLNGRRGYIVMGLANGDHTTPDVAGWKVGTGGPMRLDSSNHWVEQESGLE